MTEETYGRCRLCPEEDNEWPASEFSLYGTHRKIERGEEPKWNCCNVCFLERYGALVPCTTEGCSSTRRVRISTRVQRAAGRRPWRCDTCSRELCCSTCGNRHNPKNHRAIAPGRDECNRCRNNESRRKRRSAARGLTGPITTDARPTPLRP